MLPSNASSSEFVLAILVEFLLSSQFFVAGSVLSLCGRRERICSSLSFMLLGVCYFPVAGERGHVSLRAFALLSPLSSPSFHPESSPLRGSAALFC